MVCNHVTVFSQVGEPWRVGLAEVEHPVETRQDSLIGGEARVVDVMGNSWIDTLVGVSEECGCIATASRDSRNVVKGVVQR
jgi:hypothetical protein